ncbi:putative AT-hook motif nuclear-localized protein 7 [Iris pallida]|uniref:AT-hook motif nuclear-localized protein n=1 Tax=Iris pallida TaxID=29817 RepID=A0AAX6DFH3_IRIPA|nr:putative AT-hook motif nuclear-localized protein 7 [Iris pallida]
MEGGGAAKEIFSSLISGSGRSDGDAEVRGGEREEEYDDDDDDEEEDEGEEEEGSPFSTPSPPPAALMTAVPVPQPQPPVPSSFSSPFIMSMSEGRGGGGGGGGEDTTTTTLMLLGGKKRGRPRKYGPDGMPPSPSSSSFPHTSTSDLSGKRSRGRPPGSGRRQLLATLGEWFACSAGGSFTPHVITIAAGEDVAARILSLSQKGPRAVCILSANGTISNVTLRQPGSSGGTLTYEARPTYDLLGRFEILSLSGSFMITENSGVRSRTGGISVSLAGPDGRVVGGGVAGSLLAASPIQVVVGSFLPNAFKEHKRRSNLDPSSELPVPTSIPTSAAVLTVAMPISQANPEKGCETPSSTLITGQNRGVAENRMGTNPITNLTGFQATVGWRGLQQLSSSSEHKPSPSPDINISLPGEY